MIEIEMSDLCVEIDPDSDPDSDSDLEGTA